MMENTRIGLNAGKVWRILNEKGELSMFELCRELGLTSSCCYWLARQRKQNFFQRKRQHALCQDRRC